MGRLPWSCARSCPRAPGRPGRTGRQVRIDALDKRAAIRAANRSKRFKYVRIFLCLGGLFVLEFVAFLPAPRVFVMGKVRGQVELVGITLGLAIAIWWAMLLPVILSEGTEAPGRAQRVLLRGREDAGPGRGEKRDPAQHRRSQSRRLTAPPQSLGRRLRRYGQNLLNREITVGEWLVRLIFAVMQRLFRLYDVRAAWGKRACRALELTAPPAFPRRPASG